MRFGVAFYLLIGRWLIIPGESALVTW